jgi:hypothetical protein
MRQKKSGNKALLIFILFVAAVTAIVIMDVPPIGDRSTTTESNLSLTVAPNPTSGLYPTSTQNATISTPFPTYTPLPTYTPQPTIVPIVVDPGPPKSIQTLLWVIVAILAFAGVPFWIYKIKRERPIGVQAIPQKKIIDKPSPALFVVNDRISIPRIMVVDFILRSQQIDGPGLSIGKWKKEGWRQENIEALLDLMASMDIVSPRSVGKVCSYKHSHTPGRVLSILDSTQN